MAQRTILVQRRSHLRISDGLLHISNEETQAKIPLEDIWVVILESHMTTVTVACLAKLNEAGIGVMTCGRDHMPSGLTLPLGAHSRHARIVEDQLAIRPPLKKQLWRTIVQAKIANQAAALRELGSDASALEALVPKVRSGDPTNIEGQAAVTYFKALLESGTRRDSAQTAALDYGYGVLRAGVGRVVVGGGWLASQGIHHHSIYNAFNLVDDLIEPFRPLVDLIVMTYALEEPLEPKDKVLLARVFEHVMVIDSKRCGCAQCIDVMLRSLRTAVTEADASKLMLPSLSGLDVIRVL